MNTPKDDKEFSTYLYDLMTGDEDARVCKDIPDEACRHLPVNFLLHLLTNFFTKVADEIASAKLIFPWVLALLGAPLVLISLCVPIREAGILIPQLFVAAKIRAKPYRKYVWIFGSVMTSLSLWLCALALFLDLPSSTASAVVFASLILFAAARGICSVAAKDVLGKTVSKLRRGTLMGLATTLSGLVTILVGFNLGWLESIKANELVLAGLFVLGGLCWMAASLSIWSLREHPGATGGGGNGIDVALEYLKLLWTDKLFASFVLVRSLLLGVSLGLPALVIMAQGEFQSLQQVGLLIVAAGIANAGSGYVWGRLADRSSVALIVVCCAMQLLVVGALWWALQIFSSSEALSMVYFFAYTALSVILAGVRTGRKTLLVDMADADSRAGYVAVSNTVIGVAILSVGAGVGFFANNDAKLMLLIYTTMVAVAGILAVPLLRKAQHG